VKCSRIQGHLLDVALGTKPAPLEVQAHLGSCLQCANTLQALRSMMNLLDEWTAPEPSRYWDVRLQARLREEQPLAYNGCLQWFRRPTLSIAAAMVLIAGSGFYPVGRFLHEGSNTSSAMVSHITPAAGTAVGDLLYLDRNSDLLQNFDALDELDGDPDSDTTN
jgi:hypothetical protein